MSIPTFPAKRTDALTRALTRARFPADTAFMAACGDMILGCGSTAEDADAAAQAECKARDLPDGSYTVYEITSPEDEIRDLIRAADMRGDRNEAAEWRLRLVDLDRGRLVSMGGGEPVRGQE